MKKRSLKLSERRDCARSCFALALGCALLLVVALGCSASHQERRAECSGATVSWHKSANNVFQPLPDAWVPQAELPETQGVTCSGVRIKWDACALGMGPCELILVYTRDQSLKVYLEGRYPSGISVDPRKLKSRLLLGDGVDTLKALPLHFIVGPTGGLKAVASWTGNVDLRCPGAICFGENRLVSFVFTCGALLGAFEKATPLIFDDILTYWKQPNDAELDSVTVPWKATVVSLVLQESRRCDVCFFRGPYLSFELFFPDSTCGGHFSGLVGEVTEDPVSICASVVTHHETESDLEGGTYARSWFVLPRFVRGDFAEPLDRGARLTFVAPTSGPEDSGGSGSVFLQVRGSHSFQAVEFGVWIAPGVLFDGARNFEGRDSLSPSHLE